MLPSPSCGPSLVGVASTPSGQHSWLEKVKTAVFRWISLSQDIINAFLVHFSILLDVLTTVDHVKADSESLTKPPLTCHLCMRSRHRQFTEPLTFNRCLVCALWIATLPLGVSTLLLAFQRSNMEIVSSWAWFWPCSMLFSIVVATAHVTIGPN